MNDEVKIYFNGPTGAIAPKSTISMDVYVDASSPVNAFDLAVVFPSDKFQFLGSDNTGSMVDIWQTQPTSTASGLISFSGGIPASFEGTKGLLIKLSFKALETSSTESAGGFVFNKSDFFLADGLGTKVVAAAPNFSVSVKKNSEVVAQSFTSFEPTQSDIIIAEELQEMRSADASSNSWLMPVIILLLIVFVICFVAVYNNTKRKL